MKFLRHLPILAPVAALAFAGSISAGDSGSARFDAANKLYEEGKYTQAVAAYQQITDSGVRTGPLLFNLGNASYKSGQLGLAIAWYRQAERLTPRDPDVQANLQFVRNQVQAPTLPPRRWQQWLAALTLNEWTLLTSATLWAWLMPLVLAQIRPDWRQVLRIWILSGGIATFAAATCLSLAWSSTARRSAVVDVPSCVVHNGPLDESPAAFTVHDGAELSVLDQKDDWFQVTAGERRIGWLHRNQVALQPGH